jgi:phosphoribulokinase
MNPETPSASEVQYLGFTCRVVSSEWAEIIERDQRERAMSVEERTDSFLRTLEEIRELPCSS